MTSHLSRRRLSCGAGRTDLFEAGDGHRTATAFGGNQEYRNGPLVIARVRLTEDDDISELSLLDADDWSSPVTVEPESSRRLTVAWRMRDAGLIRSAGDREQCWA